MVSACETTGNPREGGLFGWSHKKADERQQELEREDASAQQRVTSEEQRRQGLQTKQAGLSTEALRLQGEVDRLMGENRQLEAQLRQMMGRKQLGAEQLARLTDVLKQNERLRQSLASPSGGGGLAAEKQPDAINEQNQKLHREIMALLGR
jgi:septal ring factor EnvC (AmiA/AmiB activator)